MKLPQHSFTLVSEQARRDAKAWLVLGVVALALAGFFAGMLANTKSAFFFPALVAHVDLSVLVWFLAFSCMLITLSVPWGKGALVGQASYICAVLGMVLIALSAFSGGVAYQNNYVPVIYHPVFFLALALFFCGVTGVLLRFLFNHNFKENATPVRIGVLALALQLWMAVFCFSFSFLSMPAGLSRDQGFYDDLFWAGGHIQQFAYTQLMMVAWMWLAEAAEIKPSWGVKPVIAGYALGVFFGLVGVVLCVVFPVGDPRHHPVFTMLMKHGNGLPALLVGVGLLRGIFSRATGEKRLPVICLRMSFLLFFAGGVLGHMIAGSNVTTPAHYHGSIVGVTLALMGVGYMLLPQMKWGDVTTSKMARLQPILYGGGQICWMFGMAIGGAQGVGRKIPGSADVIGGIGGFLKHGGDGLSLIGGLLFVVVVFKAFKQRKRAA